MTQPVEAMRSAMKSSGATREEVAETCRTMFGRDKFDQLSEGQQWTLICAVWPDTPGPFGHSMKPL